MRSVNMDAAQQGLGIIEWLRPGEHQRAEDMLNDLRELNINHLRKKPLL